MEKVAVIGLDTVKEELIARLMDLGALQVRDQTEDLADETISALVTRDGDEDEVVALDAEINRIGIAIDTLKKYGSLKAPLFKTRRAVQRTDIDDVMDRHAKISANVDYIMTLNDKLHTLQERNNKCRVDLVSLEPWEDYDLPLDLETTKHCDIDLGVIPMAADFDELLEIIKSENDYSMLTQVNEDKNFRYVVMFSTKRETGDFVQLLKKWGYTQVPFVGFKGTVEENRKRLKKEIEDNEAETVKIQDLISQNEDMIPDMECLKDAVSMLSDQKKLRSSLTKTRRTFCVGGWIPKRVERDMAEMLDELNCHYVFLEPEEDEQPPVAINTGGFATPFEAVTEMYSMPDYRGFDPTSIFSIFYALFFGLMLSDAGYGFVLFLACAIIMHKYNLEGMTRKMISMFEICGLFTMFWGVLFGSYFGDLAQTWASAVFGRTITIKPLWFSPIDDPTRLLIFSLLFGIVHLFVGMGIDICMKVKRGHAFDAFCDDVIWYIVIVGAAFWLAGGTLSASLVGIGKILMGTGIVLLLLTGGRHNKGFGKVTGGLSAVYNITGWISDILSYARLLALGLATGVIASVVNLLGAMIGTGFKGAVALLIVGVIGHIFSMAINILGAFVHSCRLQYVEFFGKFYEDGGEPFQPFCRDTEYIRLVDDKK